MNPFEFEPKTNIGYINSSSSDDEEGAEYKVKWTSNNTMTVASAVQKQSLADFLQNRCQGCNFIEKRLQHRRFSNKFTKYFRTPFFTEHLYSDGYFWQ